MRFSPVRLRRPPLTESSAHSNYNSKALDFDDSEEVGGAGLLWHSPPPHGEVGAFEQDSPELFESPLLSHLTRKCNTARETMAKNKEAKAKANAKLNMV